MSFLSCLKIKNDLVRIFMAELIGMFVYVCFGTGAGVQITLSRGTLGNYLSGSFVVFIGICFGVYVSGNVSGGHINPSISFALACCGRLQWMKLPIYIIAQMIGAFLAAGLIYFNHTEAIWEFDGGNHTMETAVMFCFFPQEHVSVLNGLADQIFGTALMLICIMSVTDNRNMKPDKGIWPLLFGLIVCGCALCVGYNIGNVGLNPARDLGPRLFIYLAGWPKEVLSLRNYMWFWVPTVGPMIGAPIGAWLYIMLIECHWKEDEMGEIELESYELNKVDTISNDFEKSGSNKFASKS